MMKNKKKNEEKNIYDVQPADPIITDKDILDDLGKTVSDGNDIPDIGSSPIVLPQADEQLKKGRGRPKGSKKKKKIDDNLIDSKALQPIFLILSAGLAAKFGEKWLMTKIEVEQMAESASNLCNKYVSWFEGYKEETAFVTVAMAYLGVRLLDDLMDYFKKDSNYPPDPIRKPSDLQNV